MTRVPDTQRRELVASSLRARGAGETRLWEPVSVVDQVMSAGIDVRYVDIPSFEGLYLGSEESHILLSVSRPRGRQNFTCAHEFAHHQLDHGSSVDTVLTGPLASQDTLPSSIQNRSDSQREKEADLYAAFYLMPKTAVVYTLEVLGTNAEDATAPDFYQAAQYLGVSYTALVWHMARSLSLIAPERADQLLEHSPFEIRQSILTNLLRPLDLTGFNAAKGDVFLIDEYWTARPIDLEVGDLCIVPSGTSGEGQVLRPLAVCQSHVVLRAERQGIGRLVTEQSNWAQYARVSARNFVGRAKFRHLSHPANAE